MKKQALRLLIVDDEEAARYGMRRALSTFGYDVSEAESAEVARALVKQQLPDLMLLDVNLPGISGLDFLRELQNESGGGPLVVIVTAHGSERMAVEAVKAGAYDYLSKPFELDDLRLVIKNAAETLNLRRENLSLRKRIETESAQRGALIGNSAGMQRVRGIIEKVAETDATVLVRGESGTGKELVAREIHERNSARSDKAFVAVNCAALPSELIESELFGHEKGAFTGAAVRRQGKFEQADGGTLFLDEIGELPLAAQGKLLRAIEEKVVDRIGGRAPVPIDVRVVAATNKDLKTAVESGEFRSDLFFRLAVFPLEIPPLRERESDILLLAKHFAAQLGKELRKREASLSEAACAALQAHHWPGNVRELENAIERACILSDTMVLEPKDLGLAASGENSEALNLLDLSGSLSEVGQRALRFVERNKIRESLSKAEGNKGRAAEDLGVSYKTLLTKIRDYNL